MRRLPRWGFCQLALAAGLARLLTAGGTGAERLIPLVLLLGAGSAFFIKKRKTVIRWLRVQAASGELGTVRAALDAAEVLLAALMFATAPATPRVYAVFCILLWAALEWTRWSIVSQHVTVVSSLRQHAAEREQTDDLFRDIRAQRHDFLLHVGVLQQLLAGGRFDEASAYAANLTGIVSTANEHIRGESAAVAALLHACRKQAEEQQIALDYELGVPFSSVSLPDVDQVRLLGNLLQNALEAADASGERAVHLKTQAKNGLFLLELRNATPPLPADVADSLFQTFGISTKAGGHKGLGTYVVQQIVKKHHGYLDFRYEGTTFAVKIKLPILRALYEEKTDPLS